PRVLPAQPYHPGESQLQFGCRIRRHGPADSHTTPTTGNHNSRKRIRTPIATQQTSCNDPLRGLHGKRSIPYHEVEIAKISRKGSARTRTREPLGGVSRPHGTCACRCPNLRT